MLSCCVVTSCVNQVLLCSWIKWERIDERVLIGCTIICATRQVRHDAPHTVLCANSFQLRTLCTVTSCDNNTSATDNYFSYLVCVGLEEYYRASVVVSKMLMEWPLLRLSSPAANRNVAREGENDRYGQIVRSFVYFLWIHAVVGWPNIWVTTTFNFHEIYHLALWMECFYKTYFYVTDRFSFFFLFFYHSGLIPPPET